MKISSKVFLSLLFHTTPIECALRASRDEVDLEDELQILDVEMKELETMTDIISRSGARNTIKMCVEEMHLVTPRVSVGAHVNCWDQDPNADDKMCSGTTGSDGCVVMGYKRQCWDGWPFCSPDIFCSVEKPGFKRNVPPTKDNYDQKQQARFNAVLYRDRAGDHGETNGCGPEFSAQFNFLSSYVIGFSDQCEMHDKCYWDCQIFLASRDARAAQKFCDDEMRANMDSHCYYEYGDIGGSGTRATCLTSARTIHAGLGALGAIMAYDKSAEICPNLPDGREAGSMQNLY